MKTTQEQVIQMAQSAGFAHCNHYSNGWLKSMQSFYTLVRNQALEDAAKVCKSNPVFTGGPAYKVGVHSCVIAIRNMKDKT